MGKLGTLEYNYFLPTENITLLEFIKSGVKSKLLYIDYQN